MKELKKYIDLEQSVKVKCTKVDIDNREVYFNLTEEEEAPKTEIKANKKLVDELLEVKEEMKTNYVDEE